MLIYAYAEIGIYATIPRGEEWTRRERRIIKRSEERAKRCQIHTRTKMCAVQVLDDRRWKCCAESLRFDPRYRREIKHALNLPSAFPVRQSGPTVGKLLSPAVGLNLKRSPVLQYQHDPEHARARQSSPDHNLSSLVDKSRIQVESMQFPLGKVQSHGKYMLPYSSSSEYCCQCQVQPRRSRHREAPRSRFRSGRNK